MKPGRNDPCPCGSGKKYKQCCLKIVDTQPGDEFLWRRIRRAIEGSHTLLLDYADSYFGYDAMDAASLELFGDDAQLRDETHLSLFRCWYFYNWLPLPEQNSVRPEACDGRTLARAYLDKKAKKLDPLRVRYLEQCCVAPFSFYDIIEVHALQGFRLRDIMTGEEVNVIEHSASAQGQVGDIIFAMLVTIDQVTLIEAAGGFFIPPELKGPIIDLRELITARGEPLTPALLQLYDFEMLNLYFAIDQRLSNPAMPKLHNAEGDEFILHKLHYALSCTPREAYDALRSLNLSDDEQSLLEKGVTDTLGQLYQIDFAWEKPGNEVHLQSVFCGNIHIEGAKLVIEANSQSRAQEIKSQLKDLLPGLARYKTTVIQSPQAMVERMQKQANSKTSRKSDHDDLNNPEVKAAMAKFMANYYRNWLNQKIPALLDQTPMQAVKTSAGRERVEALLLGLEGKGANSPMALEPALLLELRERLGLL